MKHLLYLTLIASLLLSDLYASQTDGLQDGDLTCEVLLDTHKRIQCTYTGTRSPVDRELIFIWHSTETPHDDRERSILIKANHGSVYDYRYYYGRAIGVWEVSVKDEDDTLLASTTFTLE